MTDSPLRAVLTRMATDPTFAREVQDRPDDVAARFDLSAAEVAVVTGLTVDTTARQAPRLEERLSRSALFFGGDLHSAGHAISVDGADHPAAGHTAHTASSSTHTSSSSTGHTSQSHTTVSPTYAVNSASTAGGHTPVVHSAAHPSAGQPTTAVQHSTTMPGVRPDIEPTDQGPTADGPVHAATAAPQDPGTTAPTSTTPDLPAPISTGIPLHGSAGSGFATTTAHPGDLLTAVQNSGHPTSTGDPTVASGVGVEATYAAPPSGSDASLTLTGTTFPGPTSATDPVHDTGVAAHGAATAPAHSTDPAPTAVLTNSTFSGPPSVTNPVYDAGAANASASLPTTDPAPTAVLSNTTFSAPPASVPMHAPDATAPVAEAGQPGFLLRATESGESG